MSDDKLTRLAEDIRFQLDADKGQAMNRNGGVFFRFNWRGRTWQHWLPDQDINQMEHIRIVQQVVLSYGR